MHRLLIIALLTFCSVVVAEDIANVFQIEIIFFEHTDPDRFDAEKWPKNAGKLDTKKAITLNSLPKGIPDSLDTLQILDALDDVDNQPIKEVIAETVTLVEPNNRLLKKDAQIIKSSKESRLIEHVAWNQALAWNVKSTPVYIQTGKDNSEISAVVSVKPAKGQYQINIDAIFDASGSKDNRSGVSEFRLTASPKMKKKEIYYLDHPVFGALIVVSPLVEEY